LEEDLSPCHLLFLPLLLYFASSAPYFSYFSPFSLSSALAVCDTGSCRVSLFSHIVYKRFDFVRLFCLSIGLMTVFLPLFVLAGRIPVSFPFFFTQEEHQPLHQFLCHSYTSFIPSPPSSFTINDSQFRIAPDGIPPSLPSPHLLCLLVESPSPFFPFAVSSFPFFAPSFPRNGFLFSFPFLKVACPSPPSQLLFLLFWYPLLFLVHSPSTNISFAQAKTI